MQPGGQSRENLVISRSIARDIVRDMEHSLPNEGCGLLAVTHDELGSRAIRYFSGTNIDRSPIRFTMDPADVLNALKTIDRAGWLLGAVVHSHPTGPNTPSPTDFAEARYLQALMLIAAWESGVCSLRAWRFGLTRTDAREVAVTIAPD